MSDGKFAGNARFKIFRGVDAPGLEESGVEKHAPGQPLPPASVLEALADMQDPGYSHRVLFAEQGMSLLHLWFKSGFVLPRHSHDTDCVYFIVAGTMRIGTAHLGPGDGFFVGAQVPYTYTVGTEGLEILEFRAAEQFFLNLLVKNPAFWTKLTGTMREGQSVWPSERRPSESAAKAGAG